MDLPPKTIPAEEAAVDRVEEQPVATESVAETPSTGRRLSKPWQIARNVVLGIIGAIFLAWLILYITKGRFLKHPFERTVAAMTHRVVKVPGDFQLYFDPINIHFVAEGMTISNPSWASKPNLFEAKRDRYADRDLPVDLRQSPDPVARHARWRGRSGMEQGPQEQHLDVQRGQGNPSRCR